ncbi:nudix hydrolase 8 [Nasonia vitripennis]|uniref:Nucleoside diphosphate-linked moiety X motif 6 n=1 Tax=Nasonia vitripennis TaxID=7425 RepID=A0A7M7T8H8_NASVI|nr:nudix hydrolase 8 [Nasonia vitripennis]
MAQHQENCFCGQVDRYNGITVDSKTEPCDVALFPERLEASLNQWAKDKRRTIWFRVDLNQSYWIPELTKRGFQFHHAKQEQATLYRWLPEVEMCNVPPYAHTNLGVGAVVLNEETKEILVVRERHSIASTHWKLPGGYVEPGEDMTTAVEREVLEETGVIAKFKCMLAFRHAHRYAFGCSDIYTISCLIPQTFDIVKCDREISECKWMKLDEFISHPHVHDNNRLLASKVMEYLEHGMGITVTQAIHPINKKPISVYSVADTKDS